MRLGENCKLKLHVLGAREMAQWEKRLPAAAEPDSLSLIPGAHTVEGENSFWQVVL